MNEPTNRAGPDHPPPQGALGAVCAAARVILGAAAVSVAVIDDAGGLRYVAADGAGASGIVGVVLSDGRGLASYVAATGQPLVVGQVADDPRFARDVAERAGYVPSSMVLIPIHDVDGDSVGVLSVLDRSAGTLGDVDALRAASVFADIAAHVLPANGANGADGANGSSGAGGEADGDVNRSVDGHVSIDRRLDRLPAPVRQRVRDAINALVDAIDP